MKQQYIDPDELVIIKEDAEKFNLSKWLLRMLRLWPWFLVSLLTCLSVAYFYLLYTNPVFKIVASVMVKDEKKGAELINNAALKEIGLGGSAKLVENEIEILKSDDLMEAVVRKLQLFISVKHVAGIRDEDVFGEEIPFSIEIINPNAIKEVTEWSMTKTRQGLILKNQSNKAPVSIQYGQTYHSWGINFRCIPDSFHIDQPSQGRDTITHVYKVNLNPIDETTLEYIERLSVEAASKLGTVINLKIKDTNKKRGVAALNSLIYIYNQQALEDKNRVTDNTVDFLNDRLIAVAGKLQEVEGSVEKLKSNNKVTYLSSDAQQYLATSQQVDVQKAQSQTQLNIINALERDLEMNKDNPKLVPSTLGLQEPSLSLLIEKHNDLVLQKERVEQKAGAKNPLLIDLQNQLKELRSRLLTNVRNLKEAYMISLNDISHQDEQLSGLIRNVPQLEKKLVQITRNQTVQEQLYTFLLQKREEAALTRASNVQDSKTIVKARNIGTVWPKSILIWLFSIMLGITIPATVVSLKDSLNNKIGDISQVEQFAGAPLLGQISHVRKLKSPLVISPHSKSVVGEEIRNIRTAISFTGKGEALKTILVTSFQLGDGKSFVSLNLAAGYALLDKKTVILEFDLRKPQITKGLGIDAQEGISNILSGKSTPDELLVQIPGYNNNLFLIPAGYLPPNPAELISGQNMVCLIKTLKENFDHIIIDTPPFSLVTDASLLQQYADITLIILRQDHTSCEVFRDLRQRMARQPDHSLYLLLNDVGKNKRYQRGYKYGSNSKGYYRE